MTDLVEPNKLSGIEGVRDLRVSIADMRKQAEILRIQVVNCPESDPAYGILKSLAGVIKAEIELAMNSLEAIKLELKRIQLKP